MALNDRQSDNFIRQILLLSNDIPHGIRDILNGTDLSTMNNGAKQALFQQVFDGRETILSALEKSMPEGTTLPVLTDSSKEAVTQFVKDCVICKRTSLYKIQAEEKAKAIVISLLDAEVLLSGVDDVTAKLNDYLKEKVSKPDMENYITTISGSVDLLNAQFATAMSNSERMEAVETTFFIEKLEELLQTYTEKDEFHGKLKKLIIAKKDEVKSAKNSGEGVAVVQNMLADATGVVSKNLTTLSEAMGNLDGSRDRYANVIQNGAKEFLQRKQDAREAAAVIIQKNVKSIRQQVVYKKDLRLKNANVQPIQRMVRSHAARVKSEQAAYIINKRAEEIILSIEPGMQDLLDTLDLGEIERNKIKITDLLKDFENEHSVVKNMVATHFEGEFANVDHSFVALNRDDDLSIARINHILGDAGMFVRDSIKEQIAVEVRGTMESLSASLTSAVNETTLDSAKIKMEDFIAKHCPGTDKLSDKSMVNTLAARGIAKGMVVDLPEGYKFDINNSEKSGKLIIKELERQYELSSTLSQSIIEELGKIPTEKDIDNLSNHIPHAISDLLNGIDSPSKSKYFGSRNYTGLSQGARKNFFG
jgi:hypothetical protein